MVNLIKLEKKSLRDHGVAAPELSSMKPQHWKELLKLKTSSARRKYYYFLSITAGRKENEKIKKEERARSFEALKKQQVKEDDPHSYTLAKNTVLLRIANHTMKKWLNTRLRQAMQFGDKIIFDCSYDQHMTRREGESAAKQLMISFADNRKHREPFDLHFCNVNYNSDTFQRLTSYIPNLRAANFPLNLYEGSYLNLFPKEKLVYLTPHCRNDLTEYDHDATYIIGAMVDKSNHQPLSLMKAKELNLKMARLPLDRYLDWGTSSARTLTLDQMMNIMLTLKQDGNWESALKHVPRRKIAIGEVQIANGEVHERKEVRKWTVNSSKFSGNEVKTFNYNSIDTRDKQNTLPTAEKLERKHGTAIDSKLSNKFTINVNSAFHINRTGDVDDSTVSTADKFKKSNQINRKDTNMRGDVKELFKK